MSKDLLDEGVQKILDRLIFIRVAEDREVEPPTLIPLIREWESRKDRNKIPLYKSMVAKFRELNEIYNSNLFSEHPFEEWEDHSDATKRVVDILYGKKGYYEYDFKVIPADVLGSVYENYLGYRLSKSRKGMTLDIDARKRKEQGIYYTPDFIVDYIVKNSLKPVLDKCKNINDLKKIKVLDPACGSGSFLIKALEVIYDKYREFGNPGGVYTKLTILLDNIFGVDLDSQAVEIARLNLLINTLDNRMRLPPLDKNIKNGNSLISGSDEESKKYFGKNYRDKKPFNWQEEFPDVFKQGGFGAIVGNPPYIQLSMDAKQDNDLKKYLLDKYQSSMGRLNTFGFFIRLGIDLLKENGILGFIIPNTLLTQDYYRQLRETILNYCIISNIVTFQDLPFKDAVVENIIIIVQKTKSERERNNNKVIISYVNEKYEILSRKKINQRIFYESKQKTFNIRAGQKNMILKQKIEEAAEPLGNFLTINQAIALKHDRSKYLFDKKLNANYKPVLDGRDITRYFLCWSGKYLNYDIDAIHSCKRQDIFLSREKLFFRRVGDRLIATYDGKQFYALNTLVVMNLKEGIEYNLKYCLALFNSSLLNYYFLNFLKSTKKVFSEIQARQVAQLPIKIINFSKPADKAIHDRIVDLAQSMLNLNKQLANLSVNSNEWLEIQTEIGRIDKRLNAEIYKLYSLTSEEIAIVEGERKSKAFLQVSKL
ncbi:hypothetical protein AUJ73_04810 [Candidatus Gottesmanbacteria bacterium CG1_02_37_22]|uniref:site-specific DNA-methyltransferase (adenine-specific) n=1 Tax=Candidatus Gottesmanbacteria bacterium CG1_02_37_22 TaxID=1805209 RepID=A0A1J4TML5_9BACT|nr:MAG: hypothetical protein AUJ73_04810 [Candidatus Gottesmanbacteria bacterium CG1_02_37_22]